MKLHDLFEERLSDYMKRLVRGLKIKTLGAGVYSTVFQHPVYHNVSVKLTVQPDPKYIMWMREAQKHQHNPWFPKIIGIHSVMFHDENRRRSDVEADVHHDMADQMRHIVFMEKLRPLTISENRKAAKYMVGLLPKNMSRKFQELSGYDSIEIADFDVEIWRALAKNPYDKNVAGLAGVIAKMGDYTDLHDQNVMMRDQDGVLHPVITDPVAS